MAFALAPGPTHEPKPAPRLLAALPRRPLWVAADRGFRGRVRDLGARPAIPARRNQEQGACPDFIHVTRDRVERLRARLEERRAVATRGARPPAAPRADRGEQTASSFLGVLCLAATLDRLKP